jgi:hypothetical protein
MNILNLKHGSKYQYPDEFYDAAFSHAKTEKDRLSILNHALFIQLSNPEITYSVIGIDRKNSVVTLERLNDR